MYQGSAFGLFCERYALFNYELHTRSSDNDSSGFWTPGSLQTLGADGHI